MPYAITSLMKDPLRTKIQTIVFPVKKLYFDPPVYAITNQQFGQVWRLLTVD